MANTEINSKNKRHTLSVQRPFHRRLVILGTGFVGLLTLLIFLDLLYYMRDSIVANPLRPDLLELVDKQTLVFVFRFILYMASVGLFLYVLLHRVAGPVFRFEKAAQIVGAGDLTYRVILRRHDELRELEHEFNVMTRSLQELLKDDVDRVNKIAEGLRTLSQQKDWPPEMRQRLDQLSSELASLHLRFKI